MAVTRANLLSYLATEATVKALANSVSVVLTDTDAGLGPALDSTFAALGYYGDTSATALADADREKARAVAKYYALDLLSGPYALLVNSSIDGAGSMSEGAIFGNLDKLIARQAALCASFGVAVGAQPTMRTGLLRHGSPVYGTAITRSEL